MKTREPVTPVVFRQYPDGQIIALFPAETGDNSPVTCSSYMHIGQHGAADPRGVVATTKPAPYAAWQALWHELVSVGYTDMQVFDRISRNHFATRAKSLGRTA